MVQRDLSLVSHDYNSGDFILEIDVTGLATASLTYRYYYCERVIVIGVYNGGLVNLIYLKGVINLCDNPFSHTEINVRR
jgi:hypothetical protein